MALNVNSQVMNYWYSCLLINRHCHDLLFLGLHLECKQLCSHWPAVLTVYVEGCEILPEGCEILPWLLLIGSF